MERNEAETIADLATRAAGSPQIVTGPAGRNFLVTPDGVNVKEVTDPHGMILTAPSRIKQAVTVQTLASLVEYLNRFKTDDTVLFANIDSNTIVGAVDYHGPTTAAHVDHAVTLTLPYSVEWKTWSAISGKLMSQMEFARFLEENSADVAAPSGAELLDACRDLQAVRKVDFKKAVRTSSDNENFEYSDTTDTRTREGSVELPTKFLLRIPVYFGDPTTELYAFLRWKLDEGHLLLGVQLHRAEHVRQSVFQQHVLDASERTSRPGVFGRLS